MFQGQERRVIIVSTVRSSEKYIESDVQHKLGFLFNPKRFNVAITRACALLIIVGNPAVLQLDPNWGALLKLCVSKNAYRGAPLPLDDESDAGVPEMAVSQLAPGGPGQLGLTEAGQLDLNEPTHAIQEEPMEMPELE
eukprot:4016914-Pleurochrysis_carterae.AAC.1